MDRGADELLARRSSFKALRQLLDCHSAFVAIKHAIRITLSGRVGASPETRSNERDVGKILAKDAQNRPLRRNFQPDDITLASADAAYAVVTFHESRQINSVLDIRTHGPRPVGAGVFLSQFGLLDRR